MYKELRNPLVQPEGFVGEQVSWYEDSELNGAQILSRSPRDKTFLSVMFPGNQTNFDHLDEEGIWASTPSMTVGWETDTPDASKLVKVVRDLVPAERIQDYFCVPPTKDKRYFTNSEYYTTSAKEALSRERQELSVQLRSPLDFVTWKKNSAEESRIAFHTNDTLAMSEGFLRTLMQETSSPRTLAANIANLEPMKAFYRRYVELDLHSIPAGQ